MVLSVERVINGVCSMKKLNLIYIICLSLLFGLVGCGQKSYLETHEAGEISETGETSQANQARDFSEAGEANQARDFSEAGEANQADEIGETDIADESGKISESSSGSSDTSESSKGGGSKSADDKNQIYVQVAGAVKKPGVYTFSEGARVYEAIEKARGLKKNADDRNLNQALVLQDGMKIYVEEKNEVIGSANNMEGGFGTQNGSLQDSGSQNALGLVNINTADSAELQTLSGIGVAKAQAIISYREANGGFARLEDLMKVDGIGEATFQKLKSAITL